MKGGFRCLFLAATLAFPTALESAGEEEEEAEKPFKKLMSLIGPADYFHPRPEAFGGEEHEKLYDSVKRECQLEMIVTLSKFDAAREALFDETAEHWDAAKAKTDLDALTRLEKIRENLNGGSLEEIPKAKGATGEEQEIARKWNVYLKNLDRMIGKMQVDGLVAYKAQLELLVGKLVKAEKLDDARTVKKDAETIEAYLAKARASMPQPRSGSMEARKRAMKIPEDARTNRGHSYAAIMEAVTWEEAKSKCEALGGHLVIFDSIAEANWVRDWLKKGSLGPGWIGLSRESAAQPWKWVDGSDLNPRVEIWARGQPNNGEDELCAYLHGVTGMHDGRVTSKAKSFICEWPGLRDASRLKSR